VRNPHTNFYSSKMKNLQSGKGTGLSIPEAPRIYSIVLGSLLLTYVLYQLKLYVDNHATEEVVRAIQTLRHKVMIRRRPGSDEITLPTMLGISSYIAANILCLAYKSRSRQDLSQRATWMFIVNIAPLYIGYRACLVYNYLSIRLRVLQLCHRWIGRVCILHGFVHSIVKLKELRGQLKVSEYLVGHLI
jgi:hypothetical protein